MNIKKFFSVGLVCSFTFVSQAQADFEEMVLANTKKISKDLGFSDKFLAALPNCSPFTETRQEMGADVVYELKGFNGNGKCVLESSSQMSGFSVTTSCKFDREDLEIFTDSQKKVRKLMDNAKSLQEILTNENYLIASGMMLDEEKCSSRRSAYDPTKELRQKLKKCEAYSTNVDLKENGKISMQIIGKQGSVCRYNYTIYKKAPSVENMKMLLGEAEYQKMKDFIKDQTISVTCSFTDASKEEYAKLLEKTTMPEGDAYDFEILEQIRTAQKKANDFLFALPECKYSFQ